MRISPINKPLIFITMGDPAGIGPEIIVKALASPGIRELASFVIIGDNDVFKNGFSSLSGMDSFVACMRPGSEIISIDENRINIFDPCPGIKGFKPGSMTVDGARKALECVKSATELMRNAENREDVALVTAPVDKGAVSAVHRDFTGHTEYLQAAFDAEFITMVMIGNTLRASPVTRHVPVKDVSGILTEDIIIRSLGQIIDNRVLICGKDKAVIGVCGLNPHCGENGRIGHEEIEIIMPALEKTRARYPLIEGPVPGDVIFYKALQGKIDIVVSMYHDQGLAPFKMVDFDNGVNMTLGLGFIRTSPDHGTAVDIAGKGIASSVSMECAIRLAAKAVRLTHQ